jgi:hypothetical protein
MTKMLQVSTSQLAVCMPTFRATQASPSRCSHQCTQPESGATAKHRTLLTKAIHIAKQRLLAKSHDNVSSALLVWMSAWTFSVPQHQFGSARKPAAMCGCSDS